MSWTSILTALVLAIVSVLLVACDAWEPRAAFAVVGIGAIVVCLLLLLLLLAMAEKGQRQELLEKFFAAMRRDFRVLLDSMRGRR